MGMDSKRCQGAQFAEILSKTIKASDYLLTQLIIKIEMIKLFSMFVRYAQLPEKQFARLSATQIFNLAELADQQKELRLQIEANEQFLNVRRKGHEIKVEALANNRQLSYTSTLSPSFRFNYLGSRWVSGEDYELKDAFEKDLK